MLQDLNIPPAYEERIVCSVVSSLEYDVPADILLAVAELENGKVGSVVRNGNGTVDIGPMQFNSAYLKELRPHGIMPEDVNSGGCYPYRLAAWRIKKHIECDSGDIWTRAANYHSRTPRFNAVYRDKLMRAAKRWAGWLKANFATRQAEDVATNK